MGYYEDEVCVDEPLPDYVEFFMQYIQQNKEANLICQMLEEARLHSIQTDYGKGKLKQSLTNYSHIFELFSKDKSNGTTYATLKSQ